MQACRTGLVTRLRQHCIFVLGVHCAAHKYVLAIKDVAGFNELQKLLDDGLAEVYALFSPEPKRFAVWKLFAKPHGVTALKFPLYVITRCFSRAICAKTLVKKNAMRCQFLHALSALRLLSIGRRLRRRSHCCSAQPSLCYCTPCPTFCSRLRHRARSLRPLFASSRSCKCVRHVVHANVDVDTWCPARCYLCIALWHQSLEPKMNLRCCAGANQRD